MYVHTLTLNSKLSIVHGNSSIDCSSFSMSLISAGYSFAYFRKLFLKRKKKRHQNTPTYLQKKNQSKYNVRLNRVPNLANYSVGDQVSK